MKNRKLASVLLMFVLSVAAFAADLKNEDGVKYEIKIYKSEGRVETTIDGGTTISQICSECEIEVVGVGRAKISGAEVWIIKDGKLGKQE
ncbi:MAG: hypothetical protein M3T96_00890 [Acidobacteriota bacterium]|nr:hypothetical protein [Acidobacteriota bacterium]